MDKIKVHPDLISICRDMQVYSESKNQVKEMTKNLEKEASESSKKGEYGKLREILIAIKNS